MPVNIFTAIDDPLAGGGPNGTVANGINNAGLVVGHFSDGTLHGFLLSGTTFITLDVSFSASSNATEH